MTISDHGTNYGTGLAYGYLYRYLDSILPDGLTRPERDEAGVRPKRVLAQVLRRCEEYDLDDEEVGRLIDLADPDVTDLEVEEGQCAFALAWWWYDHDQLSVKQAADALGVSESRVKALLAAGRLHGYKDGRSWRIFTRSVEARKGDA